MCCKQNLCYWGPKTDLLCTSCLSADLSVSSTVCSFVERMQSCLPGQAHRAALRSTVQCSEIIRDNRKSQKLSVVSCGASSPLFVQL